MWDEKALTFQKQQYTLTILQGKNVLTNNEMEYIFILERNSDSISMFHTKLKT